MFLYGCTIKAREEIAQFFYKVVLLFCRLSSSHRQHTHTHIYITDCSPLLLQLSAFTDQWWPLNYKLKHAKPASF